MKGKQLIILLVLVLVLGAVGYYVQTRNRSSWSETGGAGTGAKVVDFPINDVARVRIQSPTGELNLVRKNEEWVVRERGDYPANYEQVSGLLRKLWELKTVQNVKAGASQLPRLGLSEPGKGESTGALIELKGKEDQNLAALLVGKPYLRKSEGGMGGMGGVGEMGEMPGFPAGRYVRPVDSTNKISLVSETLDDVDSKPERWLRKDFIKIDSPKSIALAGPTEALRWTLTRESATGEWKLADAKPEEKLDTGKVSSFATLFSNPTPKDVLAQDAKPEETGLDKPTNVTIETFDNFSYALKIGKVMNDGYPIQIAVSANIAKERTPGKDEKPEDKTRLDEEHKSKVKQLEDKLTAEKKFEQRTYLLEKFTVEALLKERSALLAENKPETPAPAAPGGTPPSATTPPVSVTTPPVSVEEVATPPVAVPPATTTTPGTARKPAATPRPATTKPAPKGTATPQPAPPQGAPKPAATPAPPPAPAPRQP